MQVMPMMDDKSPDGRGVFAIPRVLTAMTNRHFVDGESPPLGGRGEFACVYPLAHSGRGLIESVEVFHLFDLTVNNMGSKDPDPSCEKVHIAYHASPQCQLVS